MIDEDDVTMSSTVFLFKTSTFYNSIKKNLTYHFSSDYQHND